MKFISARVREKGCLSTIAEDMPASYLQVINFRKIEGIVFDFVLNKTMIFVFLPSCLNFVKNW